MGHPSGKILTFLLHQERLEILIRRIGNGFRHVNKMIEMPRRRQLVSHGRQLGLILGVGVLHRPRSILIPLQLLDQLLQTADHRQLDLFAGFGNLALVEVPEVRPVTTGAPILDAAPDHILKQVLWSFLCRGFLLFTFTYFKSFVYHMYYIYICMYV